MQFSRRLFLGAGLAGAGALAFPRAVRALGSDINVVIMFAYGAWDPVLSIDPKMQSQFVDQFDTGDAFLKDDLPNGISIWASPEHRPNITTFFEDWGHTCALVRGVNVGSIAHQGSIIRMMTGTRTELSPDFAAINAVHNGSGRALPYTDIGGGAFAGPYAASMGRLGERKQLVTLLDRSKAFDPAGVDGFTKADIYVPPVADDSDAIAYLRQRAERLKTGRAAHGDNLARMTDYVECFARANAVRDNPAFKALTISAGDTAAQIATAVELLKGTSRSVCIRSDNNFDSHDNYGVEQNASQNAFFADLAVLMNELQIANILDKTVVVAMSEMGRTPRWNDQMAKNGKDHWPVTSALVLGGPVKAGVYGGTDERVSARPVDLKTGALLAPGVEGPLLNYDNFTAGILKMCGLDMRTIAGYLPDVTPFDGFIG